MAAIQKLSSEKIQIFSQYIISAAEKKNFIWIAGNGGSATTAAHLATDLNKGIFLATQLQFRAICLNESLGITTAWSNDTSYEYALSGQISSLVSSGDLVIIISGSGNSKNVINLASTSRKLGANVITMTGMGGGEVGKLADFDLCVDSSDMQTIENIHLISCHAIFKYICNKYVDAK